MNLDARIQIIVYRNLPAFTLPRRNLTENQGTSQYFT